MNRDTSGVFFVVTGTMLFSLKGVAAKWAYPQGVDAITLLVLRMGFALPVYLFVWMRMTRRLPGKGKDWFPVAVCAVFGYYLSSLLDFVGLQYVSAGLERMILYLYPTFVVLLSAWIFQQRVSRSVLISLVMSYGGLGLLFWNEIELDQQGVYFGTLCILGSAFSYAIYLVFAGKWIVRLGSTRFTAMAMSFATGYLFVHFSVTHSWEELVQPISVYAVAFFMAFVCTLAPSFLLSQGIALLGGSQVAALSTLGPLITLFAAWVVLGESVTGIEWIGVVLVLAGGWLVARRKGRNQGPRTK